MTGCPIDGGGGAKGMWSKWVVRDWQVHVRLRGVVCVGIVVC